MPIKLKGATSGDVTIDVPDTAGLNTVTIPAATGTAMVSGNMPAFSAYASASQTITLSTATKVAIDTENFDTASCFDTATNRFTPNVAGYYQVNGSVRALSATTFTGVIAMIYKNGAEHTRRQIIATLATTGPTQIHISEVIYFNGTTDYIELYGFITGTGTATFNYASAAVTSTFSAVLVRTA